jgi:hypothetical protein
MKDGGEKDSKRHVDGKMREWIKFYFLPVTGNTIFKGGDYIYNESRVYHFQKFNLNINKCISLTITPLGPLVKHCCFT